jgi:hypothetical protein
MEVPQNSTDDGQERKNFMKRKYHLLSYLNSSIRKPIGEEREICSFSP